MKLIINFGFAQGGTLVLHQVQIFPVSEVTSELKQDLLCWCNKDDVTFTRTRKDAKYNFLYSCEPMELLNAESLKYMFSHLESILK